MKLKHLKFPLSILAIVVALALLIGAVSADNRALERHTSPSIYLQPISIPIINPDFEDGFHQPTGEGELTVGVGWYPGYDHSLRRPEWIAHRTEELGPGGPPGVWTQKMFVTYGIMDGWIRQDVDAVPDAWYKITAWVYMRSQDNQGDVSAMICVNPWGNWNALDRTTICGKEVTRVYDQWVQVEIVAPSFGGRISVFLRGVAKWAKKWNDVYWDGIRMERWECGNSTGTPTPSPTATNTPVDQTPVVCPTCEIGGGGDCASVEDVERIIRERKPVIWTPNP